MRTLCDVCEGAPATLFCAADEAALCCACHEKVHTCNKLAGTHVLLAEPSAVGRCDICENSPAFFFCVLDGSSLCFECDLMVHVGGKRSHERSLLLRQKIEVLGDKPSHFEDLVPQHTENVDKREQNGLVHQKPLLQLMREKMDHCRVPPVSVTQLDTNHGTHDTATINLNSRPCRMQVELLHRVPPVSVTQLDTNHGTHDTAMVNLNSRPRRMQGELPHRVPLVSVTQLDTNHGLHGTAMINLNSRPRRMQGHAAELGESTSCSGFTKC